MLRYNYLHRDVFSDKHSGSAEECLTTFFSLNKLSDHSSYTLVYTIHWFSQPFLGNTEINFLQVFTSVVKG